MESFRLPKLPPKLLLLGLLGIGLLLIGNVAGGERSRPKTQSTAVATVPISDDSASIISYQDSLRKEAERVLGQIRGSGKIVVSVTLAGGPETVVAGNVTETSRRTEERDNAGTGVRVTEEKNRQAQPVIARQSTAGDKPVITRVVSPVVEGVLIVSSGASDPKVRAEISRAAQVLFNVPAHRVQVLPMKAGE